MNTDENREQKEEIKVQKTEGKMQKVKNETPKKIIVQFLKGSTNEGEIKEVYYAFAKKLEATGKVRIVK